MGKKTRSPSRMRDIIVPVIVLSISLILLLYIGYGEAYRTYPNLQFETLAAVGEVAQNTINTFLRAGFPLVQFPGFSPLTDPLIESEVSISEIRAVDKNNSVIFFNGTTSQLTPTSITAAKPTGLKEEVSKYRVYADETFYIVSLPLRNKFEDVGSLQIVTQKSIIKERINAGFKPGIYVIIVLLIFYGVFILLTEDRWKEKGRLWLTLSYSTAFLAMAAFVMFTLIGIFSSGVQGKIKALSRSVSERIDAALSIGLEISTFSGLEDSFSEYQKLNPEISFIALTEDNIISIHTNSEFFGKQWEPPGSDFQFSQNLYSLSGVKNIHIGIPRSIINKKLWRYAKNFLVLLIASGFLSALFLNLMISFRRRAVTESGARISEEIDLEIKRDMIKPVYFLAVFMEGLHASFLPQFIRSITEKTRFGPGATSVVFMIYFAAYALTIIPAGWFTERRGSKPLIATGSVLSAGGLILMAFFQDFYLIAIFRMISGMGQGMLFIGVQSYLIKHTTSESRTRGTAVIVYGYNGGRLSGVVIGALLVLYMKIQGVLLLGSTVGVFVLLYSLMVLAPSKKILPKMAGGGFRGKEERKGRGLHRVFGDFEFMKTVLLVGISTKAVLTGVIIFALPLLLAGMYFQEDIGQIIMFYAAGVLISSRYASRLTDRVRNKSNILLFGMLGAGIGLALMGLMNVQRFDLLAINGVKTIVVVAGILILGFSHGFIHAPIVTHITETRAARRIGPSSVASFYRFLERIGHVIGPLIIGSLLLAMNYNSLSISLVGAVIIGLGILFLILRVPKPRFTEREAPS